MAFAQTSEKHKAAGETYRSVRRKFEMFYLKFRPAESERGEEARRQLEEMVASLDEIAKSFPSVPYCCYERAKEEQRLKEASESNPFPRPKVESVAYPLQPIELQPVREIELLATRTADGLN